jgi:hypothetical protein
MRDAMGIRREGAAVERSTQSEQAPVEHISGIAVLEAINVALGIWLIASPYFLKYAVWHNARVNAGVMGSIVFGMALTRLAMSGPRWWWLHFASLVVGIWLIVAPFLLGYAGDPAAMINSVVVGLLVLAVEVIGLLTSRRESPATRRAA